MKHNGFTLVELMVTLAIAAIVLTIGIPSFQSVIRNNQLTTQINSLVGAINLARSEAIKRDARYDSASTTQIQRVAICAKASGSNICSSTSDWTNGWIVFLSRQPSDLSIATTDADSDGTPDDILRIYDAMPSGYTLKATSNFVAYDNTGINKNLSNPPTVNLGPVAFSLCYGSYTEYSKVLNVYKTGRPKVGTALASSCP